MKQDEIRDVMKHVQQLWRCSKCGHRDNPYYAKMCTCCGADPMPHQAKMMGLAANSSVLLARMRADCRLCVGTVYCSGHAPLARRLGERVSRVVGT